jgi:FAD:protein FMN transferase
VRSSHLQPVALSSRQSPERWTARAQIWLGTLVEIALPPADATEARFATAFAAIAHVHRKMNAHDQRSDVARIARDAHRRAVVVDPATHAVLRLAQALFRETGGAFDVTVTPAQVRVVRPRSNADGGRMDALRLESRHRVRATSPVAVDLGGIAKGFAVDRAVAALRAAGALTGIVNAGGDLRVFGPDTWIPIRVRSPQAPTSAMPLFELHDAAAATSADYFRADRGGLVDARARPRSRRAYVAKGSITVAAPNCALADALTKIVALVPTRAPAILARHGAHAFRLDADTHSGQCLTTCTASTRHLRLPQLRIA